MKLNEIKTPVASVSGVGPALTKVFSKLNIFTVGDLLQYYPYTYEDRTQKVSLKDFSTAPKVHTVAQVVGHDWFGYNTMKTLKIIIDDGTCRGELICFNRPFLEKMLPLGSLISITGQFSIKYNSLQCSSFEFTKLTAQSLGLEEKLIASEFEGESFIPLLYDLKNQNPPDNKVLPVYHLCQGLTQKVLIKTIAEALKEYGRGIDDEISLELIEKRDLFSKQDSIYFIHQPENLLQAEKARKSLAYEELYKLQYAIGKRCIKHKGFLPKDLEIAEENTGENKQKLSLEDFLKKLSPLQERLYKQLPFQLTEDQRYAISQMNEEIDKAYIERSEVLKKLDNGEEIEKTNFFTMNRLLQGDVGSGKTLIGIFVCLRVINWKGQCAFMAPTEILARQHAETAARILDFLGIRVAFLTGNLKSKGRKELLKALREGNIDIVIGTHALFSQDVIYKDLQLVVIDEQHRFGVMQRQAILAKGRKEETKTLSFEPHLLMMSATPIPQSLALTVFGDLDLSIIKSKPQGRKEIQTYLIKEGNEINAYEAVKKELLKAHQAYFVYPAIENLDDPDKEKKLKSAEYNFEKLSKGIFSSFKCALLHSKISEEDQEMILRDFNAGKIQILFSTTVIEVGVDVPNATCMLIEQADHFGLSQLHQLRGRVGRGNEQSYCFLIYSKNITETGIERMKVLRQSTDGFYIAEKDLKTRGPGELNGTSQSGSLEFDIADLSKDKELLFLARSDAFLEVAKEQ